MSKQTVTIAANYKIKTSDAGFSMTGASQGLESIKCIAVFFVLGCLWGRIHESRDMPAKPNSPFSDLLVVIRCTDYCCNPDDDPVGPWCVIDKKAACVDVDWDWDYCRDAGVANACTDKPGWQDKDGHATGASSRSTHCKSLPNPQKPNSHRMHHQND